VSGLSTTYANLKRREFLEGCFSGGGGKLEVGSKTIGGRCILGRKRMNLGNEGCGVRD